MRIKEWIQLTTGKMPGLGYDSVVIPEFCFALEAKYQESQLKKAFCLSDWRFLIKFLRYAAKFFRNDALGVGKVGKPIVWKSFNSPFTSISKKVKIRVNP